MKSGRYWNSKVSCKTIHRLWKSSTRYAANTNPVTDEIKQSIHGWTFGKAHRAHWECGTHCRLASLDFWKAGSPLRNTAKLSRERGYTSFSPLGRFYQVSQKRHEGMPSVLWCSLLFQLGGSQILAQRKRTPGELIQDVDCQDPTWGLVHEWVVPEISDFNELRLRPG